MLTLNASYWKPTYLARVPLYMVGVPGAMGAADAVNTLAHVLRTRAAFGFQSCVLKLDIWKAFDCVPWALLLEAMVYYELPQLTVHFTMCSLMASRYVMTDPLTGDVEVIVPRQGVCQGRPDAGDLFGLVLSYVLKDVWDEARERRYGLELAGGSTLPWLLYADDLILLSSGPHQLQLLAEMVRGALMRRGFRAAPETLSWMATRHVHARLLRLGDVQLAALPLENVYVCSEYD